MTNDQEYGDFLFRQSVKFNEMIIADIKPTFGPYILPSWWVRREVVRKIAEGSHYIESEHPEKPLEDFLRA